MSTKRFPKESKFVRCMKAPVKVLARARDLYVRSLTGCADHVPYAEAMGCPPHLSSLPRSLSSNSSYSNHSYRDEDLRELVRIASTRSLSGKVEAELLRSKTSTPPGGGGQAGVPRSRTVAIGRIDEDGPCEFEGDDVGRTPEIWPRSKSCAASIRSKMV